MRHVAELPASDRLQRLLSIQYLRAIAALSVAMYHVSEGFDLGLDAGAAGVDLFFVISGFVMWITTAGRDATPAQFIRRRIDRVVPTYWIATLVTSAAIAAKPQFFYGHMLSAENLVGSLLFVPLLEDGELNPVVIQGWTLSYEMLFYGIFAVCLLVAGNARLVAIGAILILLVLLHPFASRDSYASVFTHPILLEFLAGSVMGWAWLNRYALSALGGALAIGVGTAWFAVEEMLFPDLPRVVAWGIPSVLIVWGATAIEAVVKLPYSRVWCLLGDASYSIYLWHVLCGIIALALTLDLELPRQLAIMFVAVFSVTGGICAYYVVEKPMNDYLRNRRGRKVNADSASGRADRLSKG